MILFKIIFSWITFNGRAVISTIPLWFLLNHLECVKTMPQLSGTQVWQVIWWLAGIVLVWLKISWKALSQHTSALWHCSGFSEITVELNIDSLTLEDEFLVNVRQKEDALSEHSATIRPGNLGSFNPIVAGGTALVTSDATFESVWNRSWYLFSVRECNSSE